MPSILTFINIVTFELFHIILIYVNLCQIMPSVNIVQHECVNVLGALK